MENSGEVLSSTANHSSFSGDSSSAAASEEESGWTSYIDYFMKTKRRQKGEASLSAVALSTDDAGRCRSMSEYSGGCGVGASKRLPVLVEPSVVSRRLSLKEGWRRKKKVVYDESLEDTATSPISSPKLIELRDSDATHQKKTNSSDEILHSKKNTTGDIHANGANTTADHTPITEEDGACDNNELRKKGLCLVPMSGLPVYNS